MKKVYLKYAIALAIIVVTIISTIQLEIKLDYFIGLLTVIVTFSIGYLNINIQNDKIFYDLFQKFNESYDTKFNDIFNKINLSDDQKEIDLLIKNDEKLIIDYINFCAEEYLWFSKGRIPKDVWLNWRSGIVSNLKQNEVKKIYDNEMNKYHFSYYGLKEELEDLFLDYKN